MSFKRNVLAGASGLLALSTIMFTSPYISNADTKSNGKSYTFHHKQGEMRQQHQSSTSLLFLVKMYPMITTSAPIRMQKTQKANHNFMRNQARPSLQASQKAC